MNTRDSNAAVDTPERNDMASERGNLTTADIARASGGRTRDVAQAGERVVQPEPALFPAELSSDFRERWQEIQTGFVDTPREAVEQADQLVAEAIQRLAELFSREREGLESQWSRHGDVSTEDLRVALQRYRAFFQRLLQL